MAPIEGLTFFLGSDAFAYSLRAFYFVLLGSGIFTSVTRLPSSIWRCGSGSGAALGLCSLSFVAVTWYYIFSWVGAEVASDGIVGADLFFGAYKMVTNTSAGWMWSSQLLTWVVSGLCFMHGEARRAGIRHFWAFVLFGFLGAISGSLALFLSHTLTVAAQRAAGGAAPPRGAAAVAAARPVAPGALYLLCAFISLVSVVLLPLTVDTNYGPFCVALLFLHFALPVPYLLQTKQQQIDAEEEEEEEEEKKARDGGALRLCLFYAVVAGASLAIHAVNVSIAFLEAYNRLGALTATLGALAAGGWTNACQISISFDVVFTTGLCAVHVGARHGAAVAAAFLAGAMLLSPGAAFPFYLIWAELGAAQAGAAAALGGSTKKKQ